MCGITGIFHFRDSRVSQHLVRMMTDTIVHRGPDADGYYFSGSVGLGHRRLAIIDLSDAGRQPMCNEDKTIWITYNGEIYNYLELREELRKKGHRFRSQTDTEVIVHAYEEWGIDCLEKLNGMFAFALWNSREQNLWLVRDRLGIKPLFYCLLPDRILFGSEIKTILADPELARGLNYKALSYYLSLNWVPAPHTLFAGIQQLEPAHYLLVEKTGEVKEQKYWDLTFYEENNSSPQDLAENFQHLLEDSVRSQLVSDAPFGAFLSGGLDSSTISYLMSQNLQQPLETFSVHFGEPTYDEDRYARQMAASIRAKHHQKKISPDLAVILPKIVWHSEEPTADSSMVAVYHLAQETRKHVAMVLTGDGADELLAGYETYQASNLVRILQFIPQTVRQIFFDGLARLLPVSDNRVSLDFKIRQFARAVHHTPEDAHACWRMIFDADTKEKLLAPISHIAACKADIIPLYQSYFAQTNARHWLNRLLYVDTRLYLPNDMLVKIDRMTMAHGLEARVPFLDHRLVEFAAALPASMKLKNFVQKKAILRQAMQGKLPSSIINRGKQGFNVPKSRWIKESFKPFVTDHLSKSIIKEMGLFDYPVVEKILTDHFRAHADNSFQIWSLLTLSLWWQQFLRGRPSQLSS